MSTHMVKVISPDERVFGPTRPLETEGDAGVWDAFYPVRYGCTDIPKGSVEMAPAREFFGTNEGELAHTIGPDRSA